MRIKNRVALISTLQNENEYAIIQVPEGKYVINIMYATKRQGVRVPAFSFWVNCRAYLYLTTCVCNKQLHLPEQK